jgi:hypothetical protein
MKKAARIVDCSKTAVRGPVATGEPAFEISAKGRNEPVVQNLPEVKPKTTS